MSALTLAVDGKNDLFIGADGSLSRATDLQAVMQAAPQAARTLLGEMIYAADQGVPYLTGVGGGRINVRQFEAALRRTLLAVADVRDVVSLTTSQSNNVLSYNAVIRTTYGTGAVSG